MKKVKEIAAEMAVKTIASFLARVVIIFLVSILFDEAELVLAAIEAIKAASRK